MQFIHTVDSSTGIGIGTDIDTGDIQIGTKSARQGDVTIGTEDGTGGMFVRGAQLSIQSPNTITINNRIDIPDIVFANSGDIFDYETGVGVGEQKLGGILMVNTMTFLSWSRLGDVIAYRIRLVKSALAGSGSFTITGLPFTSAGEFAADTAITSGSYIQLSPAVGSLQTFIRQGESQITVNYLAVSGATVPVTHTQMTAGAGTMVISGSYVR